MEAFKASKWKLYSVAALYSVTGIAVFLSSESSNRIRPSLSLLLRSSRLIGFVYLQWWISVVTLRVGYSRLHIGNSSASPSVDDEVDRISATVWLGFALEYRQGCRVSEIQFVVEEIVADVNAVR